MGHMCCTLLGLVGSQVYHREDLVDMTDTLSKAVEGMKENRDGFKSYCCTYGVLYRPAVKRIHDSSIEKFYISS